MTRYQARPSPLTARQSWLCAVPLRRAAVHSAQPQFHCGRPPPVAAPRTLTFTPAPFPVARAGPQRKRRGTGAAVSTGAGSETRWWCGESRHAGSVAAGSPVNW
ncbi:hypothetical protein [Kitasatospora sp. NPDC017646]|uniref:hypothetical protein n=1 Tax=Kitasatospora sp. NPDC017646 TaxID=3364024 RepID=UPI0037B4FFFB